MLGMGDLIYGAFGGGRTPVERWVSKQEVADGLTVSTRTVDRWVLAGLPEGRAWRQVGGRRRYLLTAVFDWLEEGASNRV